jgi:hypothetical protein
MQAYASAELAPHRPELRLASRPALETRSAPDRYGKRPEGAPTQSSVLASAIVDGLDDYGLTILARRLLPFLQLEDQPGRNASRVAYTVATLAAELDMSPKAIRCAIRRRELKAIKRGSRWIIDADAVRAWSAASPRRHTSRQACCAAVPKMAGPSLRSVLCGEASKGDLR